MWIPLVVDGNPRATTVNVTGSGWLQDTTDRPLDEGSGNRNNKQSNHKQHQHVARHRMPVVLVWEHGNLRH